MLKYKDIIDQLSNSDKIHILCDIDSLSDKKYRILNIPGVKTGKTEDYCADELPTPLSLANSWDTELVENVADAIYEKMGEDGINLAVTDGPKVKIDPYRPAFSEDRKLAADMSAGFLRAARERRMNVCLKDFYIRSDERKWLDKEPDERYIYEYLVGPYMDAAKDAGLAAVMTTHEMGGDGYEKANRKLAALVSGKEADGEGVLGENCFAIFREVPAELTVPYLTAGGLCFKGSAVALESALNRYTHLTAAINGGSATREELDEEFRNGRAISPEMLDGAVDRLLDLVNSVKKEYVPVSREAVRELGLEAVKRSSVLLKNSGGLLPLEKSGKKKTEYKLAFAGALGERPLSNGSTLRNELSELFTEKGFEVIGSSRGYEDDGTRNSELINETKKLAEDADAIVIFLGFDKAADARVTAERNVSIPANQQELLHELGKWSLKLVAVVAGECSPDVGLDENCGAIIHAPLFTKYSAKALCQLLSGEASPTGRLANTVYNDSESLYEKHRRFVGADKMKVGVFTGYRHYDRAGIRSGYEFGYGLSYTEFSYSKLVADTNGKVTFSLKNEGERSGTEVVQLYAGINDPSGIRVKKELVAYKAVTLAPGERTTVELTYELPRVYDKTGNRFVTEQGSYTLYVGASVSDIRLTSTIEGGGEKLEPDSEKISEYIETESNIICDDYKLEGKISTMRKSLLNFVLGGAALVLAVLLKLYCVAMALNSFFFDMFEIVLAVVGVILVVLRWLAEIRMPRKTEAAWIR